MVLEKLQFNVCPNSNCGRPFESLIVIHDQSKKPAENYYGCPHCFLHSHAKPEFFHCVNTEILVVKLSVTVVLSICVSVAIPGPKKVSLN